ncbi:MAG TPA: TIGR03013 family XrtA/PEP-CTERM system glycosyltransferase [Candidatus Sulfotelmatobacter sp.]
MIRLFRVYYPARTLVLLAVETLIVWSSFVVGTLARSPDDWLLNLNNQLLIEGGFFKILLVTGIVLMLSHGLDLYDSSSLVAKWDQTFRLLLVLGLVALTLSAVGYIYHYFLPGRDFLPHDSALLGLVILTFSLLGWRAAYSWLVQQKYFRERVYVLGTGERAQRVRDGLRQRSELGIEVVGWTGDITGELNRESVARHLLGLAQENGVHRVIVAMPDRRGTLPVEELMNLRLAGVKMEEATSWLEKISGRIEVEQLYPSWLIFADGFRFSSFFRLVRRVLNFLVALLGTVISLPLLPFVALAVKFSSPGPVLYRQRRVGRAGSTFYCYKFRTMRQDAEADTGATWATDNDPRITRVGKFLRSSRLDELPQLWCVLKGDMHFVGPRPERPEFVEMLSKEIPYYGVRHTVRPGITGWAQVQYKYGNTIEDAREKLQYDLFYIKNASVGLDFWIVFQTVKIVLLGRGAK